ncbi:MAG: PD40 domain-containing protein [Candidatus Zixiibacteriota bacterium]|nr:MAG: PD40 domain-containing protein [candidate division Zixibacteria bacterium]
MKAPATYLLIAAVLGFFVFTTCSKLSVNQSAPEVPSAPSPADGSTPDSVLIGLSWTCSDPDGDPLTYDVYLDTSATPEVLVATVDTASYTPAGLHYNYTYYWQVVAEDTTGLITEGPIWSFSFGADMVAPFCSLTSPDGGELWYIDSDQTITWEAADDDGIAFFVLEYSIDEIDNWVMIGDTISGDTRDTSWTIPSTPTVIGRVRITCQDVGGNVVGDTSDQVFTIWPQGGMIAFTSDREGAYDIFTMFADGSNVQNLTNGTGGNNWDADWSPDCSKIVFRSDRDGDNEIYIMNFDGSDPQQIIINTENDAYCRWSPLGDQIAFSSIRSGTDWDIYIMDIDGSSQVMLTSNAAHDYCPAWSPTGEELIFHSNRDGDYNIYVIGQTLPEPLTSDPASDSWADWSHDGSLIVFTSTRGTGGDNEIYTMNANGSNQLPKTDNTNSDWHARWSPDDSRILFSSDRTADWELWIMDADGSNPENITNDLGYDSYGAWSPIG